ncbi:response regulator [Croceiramulus getboli]|nr:response regulator transcription factor [Flavobacteriaceae bacterium YJPT1-3]
MHTCKIVICDDHVLFAQSLEALVSTFEGCQVLFLAKNGKDLLDQLDQSKELPNTILLDYNMPVMDGYEALLKISERYPTVKVIVLTINQEEEVIIKMLRAGARGFLSKDIHPKTLKNALMEVHDSGYFFTEHITATMLSAGENKGLKIDQIHLSERELDFLKLACTDKTYKEIAELMCLSPKTIDNYRDSLFKKLKVRSRIGLVLYAVRNHIITAETI